MVFMKLVKKQGSCCNVAELLQRRNIAETEHPDVVTLPNDVATFGVGFGWIFIPYLWVLKLKPKESRGGRFGTNFGCFFRENKLPLGGNTLGFVLGEISRVCFWKRKNT